MIGGEEKMRILCVEDHEDTCELVKALLQNFDVVCAATIDAATAAYGSAKWALLIVDEHLLDGSGLELVRKIHRRDPRTAVIVMTGDSEVTHSDVAEAGGQMLVRKYSRSFIDDLRAAVEQFAIRTKTA